MHAHTHVDCHITMSLSPTFKGFYYVVSMSVSVPPRRYSRTSFKRIPNLLPLPQNSPMSEAKEKEKEKRTYTCKCWNHHKQGLHQRLTNTESRKDINKGKLRLILLQSNWLELHKISVYKQLQMVTNLCKHVTRRKRHMFKIQRIPSWKDYASIIRIIL